MCDRDGERLLQRDDDTPETVHRRLAVYREATEPLVAFYERRKVLVRVDGDQAPGDVFEAISAGLGVAPANCA